MRGALIPILCLLTAPALALDEQEAYDKYIACYATAADRLMPQWCHDLDKLDLYARDACLMEATMVSLTARMRSPQKAVQNAEVDGKLAMLGRLRAYSKAGSCKQ
jgi:hypothetical protein